jgi:cytoskeletal protein CcmA (bactofilin family)
VGLFGSKNRGDKDPPLVDHDRERGPGPSTIDSPAKSAQSTQKDPVSGSKKRSQESSETGSREKPTRGATEPGPLSETNAADTTQPTQTADKSERSKGEKRMATIGQSIVFKGELTGEEDLEIEGQVDGIVHLANHQLTIGANGRLKAEIHAKSIVVIGQVTGNLSASERVEIQATGVVTGDVKAPRLNVQEGAVINGMIDMSSSAASTQNKSNTQSNPSAPSSAAGESLKSA